MTFNLSAQNSIANRFIAELRDVDIQQDRMRFRRNLERIGEILAYEISKKIDYERYEVETQLGVDETQLPVQRVVLATILRAGLPFHQGMLNYFDQADNAYISAYRRHKADGSFEIQLDYVATPNLDDCILILCDPMLATGASLLVAIEQLKKYGQPEAIHIATVIASNAGLENVQKHHPEISVWMGALDAELNDKSYIIPGLGDAGDLAFGEKMNK
jgi:uracil phosphoribosyltransferase